MCSAGFTTLLDRFGFSQDDMICGCPRWTHGPLSWEKSAAGAKLNLAAKF